MAKGIYLGVGTGKPMKDMYVCINGSVKKAAQIYVGIGGAAKKVWPVKGQQIFTAGGTFIVPYVVTSIDIFLVSGGNGGHQLDYSETDREDTYWEAGGGGAGGRANTSSTGGSGIVIVRWG